MSALSLGCALILLCGCATRQVRVEPTASAVRPEPVVLKSSAPLPSTPLLDHVRATLPSLVAGMSVEDVEKTLHLENFPGILTSDGNREDFRYYYELGDFELVLSFSYEEGRKGKYRKGFLQKG